MSILQPSCLPLILAGPILRRVTPSEVLLWIATSETTQFTATLSIDGAAALSLPEGSGLQTETISAGAHLNIHLLTLTLDSPLPQGCWVGYELELQTACQTHSLCELLSDICYPGRDTPGFVYQPNIRKLLHGSCRKPHLDPQESANGEDPGDGLERADRYLAEQQSVDKDWPSLLILSGDQVYVDDVAAPMLSAIHQLVDQLGLAAEPLQGSDIQENRADIADPPHYYKRDQVLPKTRISSEVRDQFFSGTRKPIFTSDNAKNHLMSLAEMFAMYLLVWSPDCWGSISNHCPEDVATPELRALFLKETQALKGFRSNLPAARRVMAHLPVAMIFDDHDVTDDWNLTAGWERAAYGHPLSRRIIGNALIAYFLFQGWGNAPEKFSSESINDIKDTLNNTGSKHHDALIDALIKFDNWHYEWPTEPLLIVLDTRTNRWRSERGNNKPSGLMDWESITDLQHTLIGHQAVIMVSPAPVFGVKLIEVIQKIFTFFGKPLLVDAENWMAHTGSAHALINLFKHKRTPHNFVILSGDVHYSFVYDVELRNHKGSPNIWQITSSGIRNEFPEKLLNRFDRLNRWLYAPWSPLNLFTKRRDLRVSPRKPEHAARGERLLNASGIGLLELDEHGAPTTIKQLAATKVDVEFEFSNEQSRWE